MRRLIVISFILLFNLFTQAQTWITLDAPSGIVRLGTQFVVKGDSLFAGVRGSMYRAYKGLTTDYELVGNNVYLRGLRIECNGYETGVYFIYNDKLYNYGGGQHISYDCQFWINEDVRITSYDFNGTIATLNTPTGLFNGDYASPDLSGTPAILGDSLFLFIQYNGVGMNKYSFSSNAWTGYSSTITEFNVPSNRVGKQYIGGTFTLGDTLYAISSYKADNTTLTLYDSTATIWKRDFITYAWSSVRTFNRAGYIMDVQPRGNNVYFLLAGEDSSQADVGVWKYDGNTFTKMPKPPSLYTVVGFYMDSSETNLFESISSTVSSDSNKVFRYYNGKWSTGVTAYSSADGQNLLIRNIVKINTTLFVSGKTYPGNINNVWSGGDRMIAYDTTYYSLSLVEPTAGYYIFEDSIKVKWITDYPYTDSIDIFINYGTVDNFAKRVYNNDSTYIFLDTLSNSAKVKLVNYAMNDSAYSSTFIIKDSTILEIDSLIYTPGSLSTPATVGIVTLHRGIAEIEDYIGADSSTTTLMGERTVVNDGSYVIDTVNYVLNYNITNPYIRVLEVKDTVIYGLTHIRYYNSISTVYNLVFGTSWKLYGGGARWVRDISVGWVANIDWQNGQSTLTLDVDTLKLNYTEVNYTWDERQEPGWSWDYPLPSTHYSESIFSPPGTGVTYNGRTYFFTYDINVYKSYQLWMRDNVNNIFYELDEPKWVYVVGMGMLGSRLIIVGIKSYSPAGTGGTAYMYSTLSYPASDVSPLSDIELLSSGSQLNSYRNYFRGIDPKMVKQ